MHEDLYISSMLTKPRSDTNQTVYSGDAYFQEQLYHDLEAATMKKFSDVTATRCVKPELIIGSSFCTHSIVLGIWLTTNLDGRLNPSKLEMVSVDWKPQKYARPNFVSAPQHLCLFAIYTLNLGVLLETTELLSASKMTGNYHVVFCVSSQYCKQLSWKRMLCSVMFSLFKPEPQQKPPNLCKCKIQVAEISKSYSAKNILELLRALEQMPAGLGKIYKDNCEICLCCGFFCWFCFLCFFWCFVQFGFCEFIYTYITKKVGLQRWGRGGQLMEFKLLCS